ncbi:MAG: cupin domain-containing protein [Anaerolineae bacterium]
MHERARILIETLELGPHPEGGYFREVYRSARSVQPDDERGPRAAPTTIFFLLGRGDVSRWHRVRSDEVWHYYEGDPLALTVVDPESHTVNQHRLGPAGEESLPVAVVPAGCWQAARPLGAYTLVGCTVGPGFTYEDFELLPPCAIVEDG